MEKTYEKRGYLLDDFRLFHLKDMEGTTVDYHYHEFPKIILLWTGNGNYAINDQRYSIQDGDIILIGEHCIHRPEFEAGTVYERTIIYISPSFLEQQSRTDCDLQQVFKETAGYVIRSKEKQKFFELVAWLERELSSERYGRSVISNALLLAFLVEIKRMTEKDMEQFTTPISAGNHRVLELMQYIDDHLTKELNIGQLAEQFYFSQYHMMHLFKKETGQSIYEYIIFKRLLYARKLISQGMSATDACYNSGFRSYSSFTRAYTKYLGSTPTGRRSKLLKREETYE